jgi:glycosyltransferase involved in cell wall biosynthesis
MLGRIFEYDSNANNKYFDVAIDIFNKLIKYDYKLIIIGSNKSNKYVEYLQTLIKNNNKIQLELDINDESKNKYLRNSNYFIQLTGSHDKFLYNKEHFGISMIESINNDCIPISINEGYPSYIIKNNVNGYLIKNENELQTLIVNIFNNTNHKISEKININNFSYNNFFNNINKIFNN